MDQLKVYSRKQLTVWVDKQSQSTCKYQDLKNGVFFIRVLQKLFPEDTVKIKYKEKPVSEYDFASNLNLVKKILNRHYLQLNLNINTILESKNCFEFATWFKNLQQGNIKIPNPEYYNTQHERESSSSKKFLQTGTAGFKTNRDSSSSKSGQKALSLARSNRPLSITKSESPQYKRVHPGKNLVEVKKEQIVPGLQLKSMSKCDMLSDFDSTDEGNEIMYEVALQESVESFRAILANIQKKANETEGVETLEEYLQNLQKAITQRS